jgi:hypothetical protein
VRLRPLTEAECYARCYGERAAQDQVTVVRRFPRGRRDAVTGEDLRALFELRLDRRGPEPDAEAA